MNNVTLVSHYFALAGFGLLFIAVIFAWISLVIMFKK